MSNGYSPVYDCSPEERTGMHMVSDQILPCSSNLTRVEAGAVFSIELRYPSRDGRNRTRVSRFDPAASFLHALFSKFGNAIYGRIDATLAQHNFKNSRYIAR